MQELGEMPESDLMLYFKYINQHGFPQQRQEWLLQFGAFATVSALGAKAKFSDFAFPTDRVEVDENEEDILDDDDIDEEYDISEDPLFKDFNFNN